MRALPVHPCTTTPSNPPSPRAPSREELTELKAQVAGSRNLVFILTDNILASKWWEGGPTGAQTEDPWSHK
jgi:hypothetical protein